MPPQGIPSHNGDEEIVVRITNVNAATKTIQFCAQNASSGPLLESG